MSLLRDRSALRLLWLFLLANALDLVTTWAGAAVGTDERNPAGVQGLPLLKLAVVAVVALMVAWVHQESPRTSRIALCLASALVLCLVAWNGGQLVLIDLHVLVPR